MKPSDASNDPKIVAKKCLVMLGVRSMMEEAARHADAGGLQVLEHALKGRDAFVKLVNDLPLGIKDGKKHHRSFSLKTALKNAEQALQIYLNNGTITGKLKESLDLACAGLDIAEHSIIEKKKETGEALGRSKSKAGREQLMRDFHDAEHALQYVAVASSQLSAMLECLKRAWYEKAGVKKLPNHQHPMSPTHVSDSLRIAGEKCLATLGDQAARNKLYAYRQSALFGIVGETEQMRSRLLEIVGDRSLDIEKDSDEAILLIEKLLKHGTLPVMDRQRLAAVRDIYNRAGTAVSAQGDAMRGNKDVQEYTALVASQIDSLLRFLQKKEKIDPCNRALAALGDEETANMLLTDSDAALRRFAGGIEKRRARFYEVLEKERINDIALTIADSAPMTFHFRDAGLACLPLRRLRDTSEALPRHARENLLLTRRAFEAVADQLSSAYVGKPPAEIKEAVHFANALKQDIDDALDYVDRYAALLKEDKGMSLGW